jgi:hypothetical protein
MSFIIRKKTLIFGALLGMAALFAPGIGRLCQASANHITAAHPCCQDKSKCGPQFNSQNCCQSSNSASRSSTPLPQANPETGKYFPLVATPAPILQSLGNPSVGVDKTFTAYAIPRPFFPITPSSADTV